MEKDAERMYDTEALIRGGDLHAFALVGCCPRSGPRSMLGTRSVPDDRYHGTD